MKTILIMGAGGRDFHDFNVVYRGDPEVRVAAFTAAQIPGIDDRMYPAALAGPLYLSGIPIRPEEELEQLVARCGVDEVVFAYSDISHMDVMHNASRVLATGASFTLLGPHETMIESIRQVIAVTAVRTGCGKSQTSRRIGELLVEAGLRVALVRHPMPYGDLEAMRVQRFATLADIDAADPTIEEREEYEAPVERGMVVYAGVDYGEILARAEAEADVIVWDGGNNDFPFFLPDLWITVTDPLRAGDELAYHPGEVNVRNADVIVVNKVDSASQEQVQHVIDDVRCLNSRAAIIEAESPVTLDAGPPLAGRRVLVVEDGPTLTHGGMAFGAGAVASERAGAAAELVDPRPWAVGTVAETFVRYPHIEAVLPAMGYDGKQLRELEETIDRVECDVVVTGTPFDLGRLISTRHPLRHARYELRELGQPTLAEVIEPVVLRARRRPTLVAGQG